MGYTSKAQRYVVGVKVTPVTKEWLFESSLEADGVEQDFTVQVSINFSEIMPKEMDADEYVSFSLIKGSLFYPLNINNEAVFGQVANVALTVAVLGAMMLF